MPWILQVFPVACLKPVFLDIGEIQVLQNPFEGFGVCVVNVHGEAIAAHVGVLTRPALVEVGDRTVTAAFPACFLDCGCCHLPLAFLGAAFLADGVEAVMGGIAREEERMSQFRLAAFPAHLPFALFLVGVVPQEPVLRSLLRD